MLKRLLLGLLVAWAGAGFLSEVNRALTGWDARAEAAEPPWLWRFGMRQPAELERCVRAAGREIPPGTLVAFASPDTPPGAASYSARWAAYFLPAHEIVPAADPAAAQAERTLACGSDPRVPAP